MKIIASPNGAYEYGWSGVLNEILTYEPDAGRLIWKARAAKWFPQKSERYNAEMFMRGWNAKYAGTDAFTAPNGNGYKQGQIFGKKRLAHRIIWAMVYGEEADHIDHINGDRSDNRLCNLRSVTNEENCKNSAMRSHNKSGVTGVRWDSSRSRWVAAIGVDSREHLIGRFKSKEDAIAARANAERVFGYHANHGRPK